MKILVADNISQTGIDRLKQQKGLQTDVKLGLTEQELVQTIPTYDALVVRSAVQVTKPIIDAATNLKVIGRAGVGVDNIDTEYATKKGIIVMNAPFGNIISAAEHTMALMLATARNISQADRKLKQKQWDRKSFTGTELNRKTLGLIGLGKVGKEVATRAKSFNMNILVYDPYISKEAADELEVTLKDLNDLLKESDFITVHTPLMPSTRNLIDEKQFSLMKPNARIINCARGGIINEQALINAIKQKKIQGAALDVYEHEPPLESGLLDHESIITTPHLGASTKEAQTNVSTDIADQLIEYQKNKRIINAINMPQIHPDTLAKTSPYLKLAENIGTIAAHIANGHIKGLEITYEGEIAALDTRHITLSAIKGLLSPFCGPTVNYINAPYLAKERKIEIKETKIEPTKILQNQITITTTSDKNTTTQISGTLINNTPHITKINQFEIDMIPEGNLLIIPHNDIQGTIASITTTLSQNNINIAKMCVSRTAPGKSALTTLNIDHHIPKAVTDQIIQIKDVKNATFIKI
ncbi:MAG: phosphoglycerate dehydrogenase [Candidatus Aenigmarchaeota archaeon]|nr:phosphoglycerate dehydrogenase [Candidatus Aenigmarchaeota archaeon]